jgi:hypothetical protein
MNQYPAPNTQSSTRALTVREDEITELSAHINVATSAQFTFTPI